MTPTIFIVVGYSGLFLTRYLAGLPTIPYLRNIDFLGVSLMARPVKWSRDLHTIREKAAHSRTQTWSRQDIEHLFAIGRASAQSLMKAIGEVQAVGGAHFLERTSLLCFLDEMIAAESVEAALRHRLLEAEAPPAPKPLRVAIPADLHSVMVRELPDTIRLSPGRLEICAPDATSMLESLALLARALQNDVESAEAIWNPAPRSTMDHDDDLEAFLVHIRKA